MSKRSYDVSSSRVGSFSATRKDNSFSSFLCTLLVVLVICGMLLLLSFSLKKGDHEKEYKRDKKAYERLMHGRTTPNKNEDTTTENDMSDIEITDQIVKTTEIGPHKESTLKNTLIITTDLQGPTPESNEELSTETESIATIVPKTELIASQKTTMTTETTLLTEKILNIETSSNEEAKYTTEATTNIETKLITDMSTVESTSTEITKPITTISTSDSTSTNNIELETDNYHSSSTTEAISSMETMLTTEATSNMKKTSTKEATSTIETTLTTGATSNMEKTFTKVATSTMETTLTTKATSNMETTLTTEKNLNKETTPNEETTFRTEATTIIEQKSTEITKPTTDVSTEESTTVLTSTSSQEIETDNYYSSTSLPLKNTSTQIICQSRKCNLVATRMVSSMNISKIPCDDFYNYACGGTLVEEEEEVDIFNPATVSRTRKFFMDFNNFYLSCKKYEDKFLYKDRIADLLIILQKEVYGQDDDTQKISTLLANLILLEAFPYLDIGIDINPKNKSSFILVLKKPKYISPFFNYWSTFSANKRKCLRQGREKFHGYVSEGSQIYSFYMNCTSDYTDCLASLQSLREDKEYISKMTKTRDALSILHESLQAPDSQVNDNNIIKLGDLQKQYSSLNWKDILSLITDSTINYQTDIRIDEIAHFQWFMTKIKDLSNKGELLNVLESIAEYSIYENIVLQSHVESRTEFCKKQTKHIMPSIANYLYKIETDTHLTNNSVSYIRVIFDLLRKQSLKYLEGSKWLNPEDLKKFEGKLNEIKLSIFSDEDYDEEIDLLNERHNGNLGQDDYPTNLIYLMKLKNKNLFSLLGKRVTAAKIHFYLIDTYENNPVYFHTNKVAYVPYGLVKKASKELPDYLVLGQVGFPLAKIIGEAFIPRRILAEIPQISKNAIIALKQFKQTMRDDFLLEKFEYDNHFLTFEVQIIDSFIDDRIAENTAIGLVTDLLENIRNYSLPWVSQFSQQKLFFLGFTQELCQRRDFMEITVESYQNKVLPPPLRTFSILIDSSEFPRVFECKSEIFNEKKRIFPKTLEVNLLPLS
ncbi:uncharacterized protein LOC123678477 isoform X1 [Harmonia axyridis]|uniref:uncharacterized protein LOC123678477 isoform X1 n=1 Tax=Harmonia axyridis TaxID=115357 RepID=UPI001E275C58|nr:uncharacterized protein LOC123678477 isoform X1 [Harmonia axyridis]